MAYFRLVSKSLSGDHPTPLEKYFLKQVADTDVRKEVGNIKLPLRGGWLKWLPSPII
jgi:hypothetical protein